MQANIRFYFKANPNQMPVRYVRVEAGNDTGYRVSRGSYPNQRPEGTCKDAATASHFGEYDGACREHPFRFIARYDCPRGSGADLEPCPDGAKLTTVWSADPDIVQRGCWDPNFRPSDADETTQPGACVFRPRVQVQDNWGYCTGTCPGSPAGDRCYEGAGGNAECTNPQPNSGPTLDDDPWVSFNGRIVVTPP